MATVRCDSMSVPTDHMDDVPERITALYCVGCELATPLDMVKVDNNGIECSRCGTLNREKARLLTYTIDNE